MAKARTEALDDMKEKAAENRKELSAMRERMAQAQALIGDLTTGYKKTRDKVVRIGDEYKALATSDRLILQAIGGALSAGLTHLGVSAAGSALAKHSAPVKKYEGYIVGGTEILLGGVAAGTALAVRDDDKPGLGSDIAFSGGVGTAITGVGKCLGTWWQGRKAQQALMQQLVASQQRAQAEAQAAQAAAAAAAQQAEQ